MLALSTTNLNMGLTPQDLVQELVGGGVDVTDVQFTGDFASAGKFTGGESEGLGIESGVMLSSGTIADAAGPNDSDGTTTSFGTPGDPQLDGLIPGYSTNDASVLEFDFVALGGSISVQYVFGSEEYNEFVDSPFNDVFGFFLDGANIALIPGTTTPVSINNVNQNVNSNLYHNNDPSDLGTPTPFLTQADGFTVVLTATADITPGPHHIKLAVADAGDTALDSWVFLQAESFISGDTDMQIAMSDSPDPVIVNNQLTYSLVATNNGPDPATSVKVEDMLPAGVTFLSASSSQGTVSQDGGVVTADLGILTAGSSATITIVAVPTQLGLVSNTATITAAQNETFPDNNSATVVTSVETAKITLNDVQVVEGDDGTKDAVFNLSLNGAEHNFAITVNYITSDVTAHAGPDYAARSGVFTFAPGATHGTIAVPIVGDKLNEVTETFLLTLSNAQHADIVRGVATGTIVDNDPLPNFYVDDVQVTTTLAGNRIATFTVALDWPSGRDVSVAYATNDGTARAGIEYQGVSGVLNFASGVRTQQIVIPVMTSDSYSANKKFYLQLSNAFNAGLIDPVGDCTIVYAAEPLGEETIDNGAAGYSANSGWYTLTNTLAHQLDYDYHAAGDGSGVATWTFASLPAGNYQVFTRWIPFLNRATNAPFTIYDGNTPLATIPVNQQLAPTGDISNGITWQSLGTFTVTGNTLRVRLSDNANGYVIADAVRIVKDGIAPQVPEMDVSALDRSIDTGDNTPDYDDSTQFGQAPLYTDSITHTFTIQNNGNTTLHLTGSPRVTMTGVAGGDFQVVTQPASTVAPGKATTFQIVFHPTAVGVRTATVSIANDDDSEHPYTFAVEGTGNGESAGQVIIDNGDASFAQVGSWTSSADAAAFHGNMLTSTAGAAGTYARWMFSGLSPGNYFVYTTWASSDSLATNAPFTVSDGIGNNTTLLVNQQIEPGLLISGRRWASVGAVNVSAGMITVDLKNEGSAPVAADAMMILREGAVPEAGPLAHNAALPQDVNNDGRVSTGDLLVLVNRLLQSASPLTATNQVSTGQYYLDVSGDGRITTSDLLMVVNYILNQSAAPQAAVAEPAATIDNSFVLFDDMGDTSTWQGVPSLDTLSVKDETPPSSKASAVPPTPAGVEAAFDDDDTSSSEDELVDLDLDLDALTVEV